MAAPVLLDADYVVYGAGAMGMAFVDVLFHESAATVIVVDKHGQPGGHWNDAYPFVRLHQPSDFYGVNSKPLERELGNYSALASRNEILAYYEDIMREFVKSKRVQYFPMCLADDPHDSRAFRSLVDKQVSYQVSDRAKIVNATYLTAVVPSISCARERYEVAEEVEVVPPNSLPLMQRCYDSYVIIGAGKTSMDAILWLIDNGVQTSRISWIMPRDSWLLRREALTPNGFASMSLDIMMVAQRANTVEELFGSLERLGLMARIDPSVAPAMYHCAVLDTEEIRKLSTLTSIVRKGHVLRVEPGQVTLQKGVLLVPGDALYVDCTTNGLTPRPPVKVFDGSTITLQSVTQCQQVFSAALIARVEISGGSNDAKNALCMPTPHPEVNRDLVSALSIEKKNVLAWRRAGLFKWVDKARLYQQSHRPDVGAQVSALWRLVCAGYGGTLLRGGLGAMDALMSEALDKILAQRSRL